MENQLCSLGASGPDTIWINKDIDNDLEKRYNEEILDVQTKTETDPEPNGSEELQIWDTGSNEESKNFLPLEVSFDEGLCSRNYICHHCKGRRRSVNSLRSHIKKRHPPEVNAERREVGERRKRKRQRKALWRRRPRKASTKLYPCPFCPYNNSYLWVLRSHVLGVHTDSRPYECTFCDYRSAYARSLRTHIRGVHQKEKPYQCAQCCYTSAHSAHLKSHLRGVHSGERPFRCKLCDYCTAYPTALRVHTMANHTGERPYQCPECDYGAVQSSELRLHIINHHRTDLEKPHRCPYCPYRSVQASHLKTHISAVHIKDPVHKCSQCPYSATYALALKRHIAFAHGPNPQKSIQSDNPNDNSMSARENMVFVDQINYLYGQSYVNSFLYNSVGVEYDSDSSNRDSSETEDPISASNTENPEDKTDSSNKNDEEESSLQEENPEYLEPVVDIISGNSGPEIMQVALNPFDYTLPCGIEDQGVISQPKKKRKRKRERNKNNIQEKQYPCPQCEYCFPKSKHLMYHMKAEHPGFKSFPCTQCDFSAPKSSLLKYHVQAVHKAAAGATVHQCPKCPYCTGSVEKLRTHIRVKHNRIRPYKCPQCSYSSTQAGHIKIHVRAKHTDEKPYHCSYCGYQSAYSSALKSHITKRHANN